MYTYMYYIITILCKLSVELTPLVRLEHSDLLIQQPLQMQSRPIRITIQTIAIPRHMFPVISHDGGTEHCCGTGGHEQSDKEKQHWGWSHAAAGAAGTGARTTAHAQSVHVRAKRCGCVQATVGGTASTAAASSLYYLGATVLSQQDAVAAPQTLNGSSSCCCGGCVAGRVKLQGAANHRRGMLINAVVPTGGKVIASGLSRCNLG